MGEGVLTTPLVQARQQVFDLLNHLIEIGHLVVHADKAALCAGAIVTRDVDDERVVQLADILHGVHEPANVHVGVLHEAGEDFSLPRKQLAVVFRKISPGTEVLRAVSQLGALRDDAHLFLIGHRLGPDLIPALVELAFVLVGPLLGDVVRRVHRTRCKVHKEGLVGRHGLLRLHPANRLVRHVIGKVITLHMRRVDAGDTIVNQRVPLVGFTPDKAIKLVKARVCRPAVKGA